ncbi:MAG: hypothetical protein ACREFP_12265 [Acetobacteraceae bacterium]
MAKYDRQLIIMFHCGTSAEVKVVVDGATQLQKKGLQNEANSRISHWMNAPVDAEWWFGLRELKRELAVLTDRSRLYIYGHCDWGHQKVGTYTGKEMANLLANCGLKKVKLISIVACKAARKYDDGSECFASQFLVGLAGHDIATEVFARWDATGVWPKDEDPTMTMLGRKWTRPDEKAHDKGWLANKAEGTKWKFTYNGGQVVREEVKYPWNESPEMEFEEI